MVYQMLMYFTVCKQNGNNDRNIASFLTYEFNGILKGLGIIISQQNNEMEF